MAESISGKTIIKQVLILFSRFFNSLIDFHAEQREQIVSKAILKLFHETDLELKPQVNVNLTKEIDRVPHESIDSILGSVLGESSLMKVVNFSSLRESEDAVHHFNESRKCVDYDSET